MSESRRIVRLALAAGALSMLTAQALRAEDTIKIGVPTALSGPYTSLGEEFLRGIEFAVELANKAGGVNGMKIEVKSLDTEAKPDLARKQAEQLVLGGYKILMGTVSSGEVLAIAPMLDKWDALQIVSGSKSNSVTGDQCVERSIRTNRADASDARMIDPWLAKRTEKKWAYIGSDINFGHTVFASFNESAKKSGKEVVSEAYSPLGTTDFAPYIQKIRSSGAEAIWLGMAGRDGLAFIGQLDQFGLLGKIVVGGVPLVSDRTVAALGEKSLGLVGPTGYSSLIDTPENKAFVEMWKARFNGEPGNFETDTFIATQIVLESIKTAGSAKPEAIVKAMHDKSFNTVIGTQKLRTEDNQFLGPNFFGKVGKTDNGIKTLIEFSLPWDKATPPAQGCKLNR